MKGIGTDIVQISRIQASFDKQGERFVTRVLSASEQAVFAKRGYSMAFLANRFAAKEAIAKALGTGIAKGVTFADIQIIPGPTGEPQVTLSNVALTRLHELGAKEVKVTLSDEQDYAVAFAVLL
jgi:holo-[acyl-carrier protein] synthase